MDYLDNERFAYENSLHYSDEKVWVIVDNDNEDISGDYDSYELALKGYNQMLKGNPEADLELGWMYENNKCSYQHPDFKSVYVPIHFKQAV